MNSKIRRFAAGFTAAAVALVSVFSSAQIADILRPNSLAAAAEVSADSADSTAPAAPAEGAGTADSPFQIKSAAELLWFAGWVNGTLPKTSQEEFLKKHPEATTSAGTTDSGGSAPESSDSEPATESSASTTESTEAAPGESTSESGESTAAPSEDSVASGEIAAPAPVSAESGESDTPSASETSATETSTTEPAVTETTTTAPAPEEEKCDRHPNACAKLTQDIELSGSGKTWDPIGNSSANAYAGTFDGAGHKITGLDISNGSSRNSYGLFDYTKGTVKDLTVEGNINLGMYVGLIAADNMQDGTITGCHVKGNVGAVSAGGGLAGQNNGTIEQCSADVKVTSTSGVSGVLVGHNGTGAEITDCIASGGVEDTPENDGGIAAYNSGTISNCVYIDDDNTGLSSGKNAITGTNNSGTVKNCYYYSDTVNGGIGGSDEEGKAEHVDEEDFLDGEVTWKLQNAREEEPDELVWIQDLDGQEEEDKYPALARDENEDAEKEEVYRVEFLYPTKDDVYSIEYVNSDETIKKTEDPAETDAGYSFDGWYEDDKYEKKVEEPLPETTNKDLTYYGRGNKIEFTIKYNLDGGKLEEGKTNPEKYSVDTETFTLNNPSKEGYVFQGWTGNDIPEGEKKTEVTITKGSTGNREYTAHFADETLPSGTIKIGQHTWTDFIEEKDVKFDLSFNTSEIATITGTDTSDDNLIIKYQLTSKAFSKEELDKQTWLEYPDGGIHIPNGTHVLYAKISDHSDNSVIINSEGFHMDSDAPVIKGVENNGKYCGSHKVIIEDENIDTVTVNGTKVELDEDNTFTITTDIGGKLPFKTIVATDKSGKSTTVKISVYRQHSGIVTETDKVPATCTEDGSVVRTTNCRYCGIEMSKETKTLPSVGHSFGEWEDIDNKTCSGDAGQKRVCTVCGFTETSYTNPDGHHWEEEPRTDKEPTCTEDGSRSVHCRDCDATKDSEVIEATGHINGEPEKENVVEATCLTDGYYTEVIRCTVCGAKVSEKRVTVPATGHTPAEAVKENVVAPTCDKNGQHDEVVYCSVCDTEIERTKGVIDPPEGHTFGEWKDIESTGTCGGTGKIRYCEVCGFSETKDVVDDTHTWSDEYIIDKEPTCTEEGSQSIHCTKCGARKDSMTVDAKGHVDGEQKVLNVKEATCTKEGSHDLVTYCDTCGQEVTRSTVTTQRISHKPYDEVIEVPATCDTAGTKTVTSKCSVCGESISVEITEIPATGHKFGDWYTVDSSTCVGEGLRAHECEVCGFTETEGLSAAGHTWDEEFTVDKEPTCTEEGSMSHHCKVCGAHGGSEAIPAKGHTESAPVKEKEVPATCTGTGSYEEAVYCSVCGEEIFRDYIEVPAKGHKFGEWEELTSECSGKPEKGRMRICTVCGYVETEGVSMNGHVWDDKFTVDKEPTCTEEGIKSIHCVNCGMRKESTIIAPLGHTPGAPVIENEKAAKCLESGSYDEAVYCEVCGEELSRTAHTVPATGHISDGKWHSDSEGHWHSCTECGTKLDTAAHTFGGWTVKTPATADADGEKVRECTVCGYIDSEVIPATGGSIFAEVEKGENAPDVSMSGDTVLQLEDELITDEERLLKEQGAQIEILLKVEDITGSVSAEDKQETEICAAELDYIIGQYIDIELLKVIDFNSDKTEIHVFELRKPILLTVEIPDELKGANREFAVIRMHNGVAELLSDNDDNPDTLTVSSDKFSTYAIVYKDADQSTVKPDDNPGGKPDDNPGGKPDDNPGGKPGTDLPSGEPSAPPADNPGVQDENPETGVQVSGAAAAGMFAAAAVAAAALKRKKK